MAHFYTYMDPAEIEAQFRKDDEDDNGKQRKHNVEMAEKDSGKRLDGDDEGKQTKM